MRIKERLYSSTHVLEVAEKLCDRVAIINKEFAVQRNLDEMRDHFKSNESLEKCSWR